MVALTWESQRRNLVVLQSWTSTNIGMTADLTELSPSKDQHPNLDHTSDWSLWNSLDTCKTKSKQACGRKLLMEHRWLWRFLTSRIPQQSVDWWLAYCLAESSWSSWEHYSMQSLLSENIEHAKLLYSSLLSGFSSRWMVIVISSD